MDSLGTGRSGQQLDALTQIPGVTGRTFKILFVAFQLNRGLQYPLKVSELHDVTVGAGGELIVVEVRR